METITLTTKSGQSTEMPAGYASVEDFLAMLKLNRKALGLKQAHLVEQYDNDIAIVTEYLEEQA